MQFPDAPTIVAGVVFAVTPNIDRESKEDRGFRVTVLSTDQTGAFGAVNVNVRRDPESKLTPIDQPALQENVAWMVRSAPYSVEGNSGMSTQFVRLLSPNDLDKLISYAGLASAGK